MASDRTTSADIPTAPVQNNPDGLMRTLTATRQAVPLPALADAPQVVAGGEPSLYQARGVAGPDDIAAVYVVRFRRSTPARVVRSWKPAHPAIIGVRTGRSPKFSYAAAPVRLAG
ncbi:hypothetical protein [Saccharothrix deserti]|uniref:hypothetical protein n=1 Tax=Saccharothrix deserti TaxID=2593674 RepID=UPI00131CC35C|nr:hypothetical protein [Saccharothrix deserti]